jgi:hypothetical protein
MEAPLTEIPPHELLDEMDRLRTRTRADRHAYVPPLLLFGVLVLLSPLSFACGPSRYGFFGISFGRPNEIYWLFAVLGGFLATAGWYLYRGNRQGVKTPIRSYLAIGLIGILALAVGLPVVNSFAYRMSRSPYSDPSFTLPIMLGATAALAALLWFLPKLDSRPARCAAIAGAMTLGFIALAMLDVYFAPVRPYAPLIIIALGLIGLAWLERSRLLGVISAVFTSAALLANLYNMENVFYHLGIFARYEGERTMAFTNLLLPGTILIVGGAVAWFRERGART